MATGATPQALNAEGVRALSTGDLARAADCFARAAALDPQAVALWLNLANAHRQLGDDNAERAALDAALAIDAIHFMGLLRRAQLHERTGARAKAARDWTGALAMAPEQLPPEIAAALAQGEEFVAAHTQAFAAAVDVPLAAVRAGLGDTELRRVDAAIDLSLGRRRVYFNECAGMHVPFLPADEFFPRRHFPWMPDIEAATPTIRAELESLLRDGDEGFAPYVSMKPGEPPNKWSPLDKSMAWNAYYLWKDGAPVERALARCPATAAAMAALPRADIPGRCPTVFFSILQPGAHIPPHTGVTNSRAIVHLPLIVPDSCGFRVGGETREWKVGEAFAFDDTIEHEAWNGSSELRAVLIFDVWNPHLTEAEQTMLRAFYAAADASGHYREPGET